VVVSLTNTAIEAGWATFLGWFATRSTLRCRVSFVRSFRGRGLRAIDNLLFAAATDRTDLLGELLRQGADVNTRFANNWIALHAAAVSGRPRATELLLARDANPSVIEDRFGGSMKNNVAPARRTAHSSSSTWTRSCPDTWPRSAPRRRPGTTGAAPERGTRLAN
jgi:ankyrin repeat protein